MQYNKLDNLINADANIKVSNLVTNAVYYYGRSGEMTEPEFRMIKKMKVVSIVSKSEYIDISVIIK